MKIEKEINQIKKRLEICEKRISELGKSPSDELAKATQDVSGIKKLAKKININEEKINEIFDLEKESLTVVKTLGKNDEEKIKNITITVILGYKYLFGKDSVLSKEIRRNIAENNISLDNFASYVNGIMPSLIRRKGRPRSPKTSYKLTLLGETKARELIKKLCEE